MRRRSASELLAVPAARLLVAALFATWVVGVGPSPTAATAATFTVEPTQIFLAGRTNSVLLTLSNESADILRFELSVFTWTQSPSGEIQLEPTEDIVFFPSLLTVGPGESRRVRVGSTTGRDVREKTYRIFVEELPPLDQPTSGVRVLTKMGIPIFLRPAKEVASATLNGLGQKNGTLRFTLSNEGTVHFMPKEVRVLGLVGSIPAFENLVDAWYVLAGGRREFNVNFPETECSKITSLLVDVQFGSDTLQERLQTPNGVCSR